MTETGPPPHDAPEQAAAPSRSDDGELVRKLLAGDEEAFAALLAEHNAGMLRIATITCRSRSVAEEVVQETWLAILDALPRFEGRSSLKTWMYRILTYRAKTRAKREGRSVPVSALGDDDGEPFEADRFEASGRWRSDALPGLWHGSPERRVQDAELLAQVEAALATLPERQRLVVTLRDVQGWTSEEVCNVLELSETNQRVLLHRGRAKVRDALATYLAGER